MPEQPKNVELLAEKRKRKAAEKEASRWHRKAVELQAQVDELEQQKQQVLILSREFRDARHTCSILLLAPNAIALQVYAQIRHYG